MGNQACAPDCFDPARSRDTEIRNSGDGRSSPFFCEDDLVNKFVEDTTPFNQRELGDMAGTAKPHQVSRIEAPIVEPAHVADSDLACGAAAQTAAQRMLEEAKAEYDAKVAEANADDGAQQYHSALMSTRSGMRKDRTIFGTARTANRYGNEPCLPAFVRGQHVPLLGLINPMSGAMAGLDILAVCRRTPYYQDRIFNIIDVVRDQRPGGLLDVFRIELCAAKAEAKAQGMRPRLISGGGDGTGSFALFMVFLALKADPSRPDCQDSGNGFIWTDEEMSESFPALIQMPLGSANDFANILGWGQKYPGNRKSSCTPHTWCAARLGEWFEVAINPKSTVVNFDIWGIMPTGGQATCDFKLAELAGGRGRCPNKSVDGKRQLHLKEAGKPVPLFVCLYFSTGFGAYMTARFQLNRHNTPMMNRLEYGRQGAGLVLERTPPQMHLRLEKVEIDCEGEPYFPPRRNKGNRGRGYREVGFYNINWQAHALHGADRANVFARLCGKRQPVRFNDEKIDMFRWRFSSILKNPGFKVQTDKKKDMLLRFTGGKGTGIFFQWDGEARFAFSASGEDFHIFIRHVLNIPVVIGPFVERSLVGPVEDGRPATFSFRGDTDDERHQVRQRILQSVKGELDRELNASREEIEAMSFPMAPPPS
mmetsp:Transcript_110781/g.320125  ORF Transcript_110781/g.320125 Transcript_110781/m.320125 type:complete len:650 (+) Transcript_110781:52-2001(+)